MKLLFGVFLIAHALIHVSYLTPPPPRTAGGPEWPFELTRSWLVTGLGIDPGVVRSAGATLAIEHDAVVVTFDAEFGRFAGVRWEQPAAGG